MPDEDRFGCIRLLQRGHAGGVEQGVGFVQGGYGALLLQPFDYGDHPFARLSPLQTLALTHFRDDRRRLQDARGQFGLAQAMFAVQVLGDQIAKGVAHLGSLSLRKSKQSANDLRRNWSCYSQRNGTMLVAVWFNQLAGRLRKREPMR